MTRQFFLDKKVVPVAQARNTLKFMETRGFRSSEVLAGTGLEEVDLVDEAQRISFRQRIHIIENTLRLISRPGFWLTEPRGVAISSYGLMGYAMMSSASLRQAINIAARYHRTAGAMFELNFSEEGDHAVLRIRHLIVKGEVSQFVVEDLFRSFAPLLYILLGRHESALEIHLDYPAPVYQSLYYRAFNCPVWFEQPHCEYHFSASLLDEPLADANVEAAAACEASCRTLLEQMEIDEDLVSRISAMVLSVPGEFPSFEQVAEQLHIGPRTLRRRLKRLHTTFQNILDEVRRELAMQYLGNTELSTQEISKLLGYSEATNFRRAFVKWANVSPFRYRRLVRRAVRIPTP